MRKKNRALACRIDRTQRGKRTKRLAGLLLVTVLLFSLSACGLRKHKIEDYKWKLRYVMHGEENRAVVDAAEEEHSAYPEATVLDMTLIAEDGRITITDETNQKTYEGTYTVESKTPEGTNYTVTIDGKVGYAGVAMTTYADGTQEPTLPISLDGYSICFYAE